MCVIASGLLAVEGGTRAAWSTKCPGPLTVCVAVCVQACTAKTSEWDPGLYWLLSRGLPLVSIGQMCAYSPSMDGRKRSDNSREVSLNG